MPAQIATQYRLFQESDLPGVLALWRDHSGWGGITEQQFRNWYLGTPNGACLVAIMEDETAQILGQMVMIPARAVLDGKPVKVLRVVAPILHSAARGNSLTHAGHPSIELYRCLWQEAIRQGFHFAYTFPAYGWQALMKIFPRFGLPAWSITELECYGIDLHGTPILALTATAQDCSVTAAQSIDAAYDLLWQEAVGQWNFQYSICRDQSWVQWRQGGHLILEVRVNATHKLLGYLVIDQRTALLADVFASSETELRTVLHAGIWALHVQNPARIPLDSQVLKLMNSHFIQQALLDWPLAKVDYTFTFGCNPFQASLDIGQINTQNWYLMPND